MSNVELGTSVIQRAALLTGEALQRNIEKLSKSTGAPPTELETFLTSGIFKLTEPKIGIDLFERVRQNISQAFQFGAAQRVELGLASIDISQALSEQVAIREQQLARTQEQIRNQSIALGQINERLSRQVTELGQSLGGFDPVKFFTDNPVIGGIGIGGLLVGGVVLLLVLR